MRSWIPLTALAPALFLAGCFTDFPGFGGTADAGVDMAPPADAGRLDATPPDAVARDARASDGFIRDSAVLDALAPDARPPLPDAFLIPDFGPFDAARPADAAADAAAFDGTPPDAARLDAAHPDAAQADAARPDAARPDAARPDAAIPDAAVPDACRPVEEDCNGGDDDCDGYVDEQVVCGPYVSLRCRVWLGWADSRQGPQAASPSWGDCPNAEADHDGTVRCTSTRGDERFRTLPLSGDVNGDDMLGLAFTCHDEARPDVAAWIQSHCAVFLGHADVNQGADGTADWGPCPASVAGDDGARRCVSSGFDGQFRPLFLVGNVDGNDDLSVAFFCRDEHDPSRAAAVQAAAEVFIAWSRWNAVRDGEPSWGECPGSVRDNTSDERCVSSQGDGHFHTIDLAGNVDGLDGFGIMLRAR